MKKRFNLLLILILTLSFSSIVNAKQMTYTDINNLGIHHFYRIGDYMFNLDSGFSPSIRDIMVASRSIPEGTDTYIEDYLLIGTKYTYKEIYSKKNESGTSDTFTSFNAKYIYKNHIYGAVSSDYQILD